MPLPPPSIARVAGAVERSTAAFTGTLRRVVDPSRVAVGTWTIGDTAVHCAHSLENTVKTLHGEGRLVDRTEAIEELNASQLASDPERDPRVLADRIDAAAAELAAGLRSKEAHEPVRWHADIELPAATIGALWVGEALVHGYDVASAEKRPYDIEGAAASVSFEGSAELMPYYLDRDAARGLAATFDVSLRRGTRAHIIVEDETLTVEPLSGRRVDCHISGDPGTFLLVGYGRIGPIVPTLTGKIVAWGRKPWLGLRFAKLFKPI